MKYNRLSILRINASILLIAVSACSSTPEVNIHNYYKRQSISQPSERTFVHCYSYGCKAQKTITLDEEDWLQILEYSGLPADDAVTERENIAQAVSAFEKIVGSIAETDGDIRGSFLKLGKHQLDCVDESINTSTYMTVLRLNGLIHHHDILTPSHRILRNGFPGWPHQTATLKERASGTKYAVDSWFRDNGHPPFVIPLNQWRLGWQPKRSDMPELSSN